MKGPRLHHYVPVFYQKHFADEDSLLWVYDRKRGTYKHLHPLAICCQNHLYSFKTDTGMDQRVEAEVLATFDGLSAGALCLLVKGGWKNPGSVLLKRIIFFAALQNVRVPGARDFISDLIEGFADDTAEVIWTDVERARQVMARYEAETGDNLGVTPEEMVEAYAKGRFRAVATERPFLESIMRDTEMVSEVFKSLDLKILVSPPQVGFVLSDNPVTLVPPPKVVTAGFLTPGTFTYVPLTRSLCLRLGPRNSGYGTELISREDVRIINENTAINSERFVMGPLRIQLESVIKRSGSANVNPKPRWMTVKTGNAQDGIHRAKHFVPRGTRYLPL
jgi:Protein of unknown function (DUF4238)